MQFCIASFCTIKIRFTWSVYWFAFSLTNIYFRGIQVFFRCSVQCHSAVRKFLYQWKSLRAASCTGRVVLWLPWCHQVLHCRSLGCTWQREPSQIAFCCLLILFLSIVTSMAVNSMQALVLTAIMLAKATLSFVICPGGGDGIVFTYSL